MILGYSRRYRLKMTNHKLQVLCLLFMLTFCTVMNDVKCTTRKECRKEIYITNNLLSKLDDAQKLLEILTNEKIYDNLTEAVEVSKEYKMIAFLVNEHSSAELGDIIFPPGNNLLEGLDSDDPIYNTIYKNEKRIQTILIEDILGPDHTAYLDNIAGEGSYETEIELRRYHLNSIFRRLLNVKLRKNQMCVNGQNTKCVLVALIKRTLNYQLKYKAQCNQVNHDDTVQYNCIVTSAPWILDPRAKFDNLPQMRELYHDELYDPECGFYRTLLVHPLWPLWPSELVGWKSTRPKVVKAGPSDEEKV